MVVFYDVDKPRRAATIDVRLTVLPLCDAPLKVSLSCALEVFQHIVKACLVSMLPLSRKAQEIEQAAIASTSLLTLTTVHDSTHSLLCLQEPATVQWY